MSYGTMYRICTICGKPYQSYTMSTQQNKDYCAECTKEFERRINIPTEQEKRRYDDARAAYFKTFDVKQPKDYEVKLNEKSE